MKEVLKYLKTFIILILLFFSFSFISCLLPDEPIRKNIEQSIRYVDGLIDYPQPMIDGQKHSLDYAMDGLITNMIYTIDNQEPVKSALMGRSRMQYGKYISQWHNLNYNIHNNSLKPNMNYARYWHGNTFFYRYFFLFTNYNEIKWIIYLLTSILITIFTIVLYRGTGTLTTLSILSGLFFVNIYIMQFSMQLSPVLIISLLSGIFLIGRYNKNPDSVFLLFFIVGGVTSYFDLLTAPLLTCGIPALIWISLDAKNLEKPFWVSFKQIVIMGALWAIGYISLWAIKWVISAPLVDFNLFTDVQQQISLRSHSVNNSRLAAINLNFNQLPLVFINLILLVLLILTFLHFNRKGIKEALLYLSVVFLPFIWYFATANHSSGHFWYTYRILAISISGVMLAIISLVSWDDVKIIKKLRRENRAGT